MILRGVLGMVLSTCVFAVDFEISVTHGVYIQVGDEVLQNQPNVPKSLHGVYLVAIDDGRVIANEQFNTDAHRSHGRFFRNVVESLPDGAHYYLAINKNGTRYWDDDAAAALKQLSGFSYESGPVFTHGTVGKIDWQQPFSRGGSRRWSVADAGTLTVPKIPNPREIPEGYSKHHFELVGYNLGRPILLHFYRPNNFRPDSPILFMMHGQTRQGDSELKLLYEMAERRGMLCIAPEFEGEYHPTSHHYERGGTTILAERYWSFTGIEHIFDYVKACTGNTSEKYFIMGHSAGGYFVHRFAIYMPDARYELAIAHNSGSYALPEIGEPFATRERLAASLQRRAIIMIGDYRLPTEPPKGKTGLRRRGEAAIAAHQALAEELGVECNWGLRFVPGIAHVPGPMFDAAEILLFPED